MLSDAESMEASPQYSAISLSTNSSKVLNTSSLLLSLAAIFNNIFAFLIIARFI